MVALPKTDQLQAVPAKITFNRRQANLGDGFKRKSKAGINNVNERFGITWILLSAADADSVKDILKATEGVDSIEWIPPGESTTRFFTVEDIDHDYSDTINKIVSCTLEEKFIP